MVQTDIYCKFGNFREDFIFAKLRICDMRSFVKIKPSRDDKITLSFIGIGKSCLNREVFTSLICLLMLFAKIKLSRKFPNLQYFPVKPTWSHSPVINENKTLSVIVLLFLMIKTIEQSIDLKAAEGNRKTSARFESSLGCMLGVVHVQCIKKTPFY